MLERLATRVVRHRLLVLAAPAVLVVAAGLFGSGVFGAVKSGGFTDRDAESSRAVRLLAERFGQGSPNLVLVVTARRGGVDSPAVAAAGRTLTDRLNTEAG